MHNSRQPHTTRLTKPHPCAHHCFIRSITFTITPVPFQTAPATELVAVGSAWAALETGMTPPAWDCNTASSPTRVTPQKSRERPGAKDRFSSFDTPKITGGAGVFRVFEDPRAPETASKHPKDPPKSQESPGVNRVLGHPRTPARPPKHPCKFLDSLIPL